MLQWINLLFFLLPNVISYGPKCFRIKDSRNVGGPSMLGMCCRLCQTLLLSNEL